MTRVWVPWSHADDVGLAVLLPRLRLRGAAVPAAAPQLHLEVMTMSMVGLAAASLPSLLLRATRSPSVQAAK